ncbi:MAG: hypothetical protein H7831_09270 [Magnetococcus sp. WYHC-3]
MAGAWRVAGDHGGSALLRLLLVLFLAAAALQLLLPLAKAGWEFLLLRELAGRVVGDYADLPLDEVQRRVGYEFTRSRIVHLPREAFRVLPQRGGGYRVQFSWTVPWRLSLGFWSGELSVLPPVVFSFQGASSGVVPP